MAFFLYLYRESRISQKILKFAAQQIGTMKSARDNKLNNWYEFAYELLAQYMLTGKIKFNPLPESIIKGYGAFGRKEYSYSKNEEAREDYNTYQLETMAEYAKQSAFLAFLKILIALIICLKFLKGEVGCKRIIAS